MTISDNFKTQYYNFFHKILRIQNHVKILNVDFDKPWYDIIFQHKFRLIFFVVSEILTNIFRTLLPLGIVYFITTNNFNGILFLIGIYFAVAISEFIQWRFTAILQNQIQRSVKYYAHLNFLTVDPIHHTTKSSGQILAKINRGAEAYEYLLDTLMFNFFPLIISISTLIITFLGFDWRLSLAVFISVFAVGLVNLSFTILNSSIFEPKNIQIDDKVSEISVENLQQAPIIRSTFATHEVKNKLKTTNKDLLIISGEHWTSFGVIYTVTNVLSIFCLAGVLFLALDIINSGNISPLVMGGLMISYLNTMGQIVDGLGRKIRSISENYVKINDLFTFIRGFGKQTYPVLEYESPTLENTNQT